MMITKFCDYLVCLFCDCSVVCYCEPFVCMYTRLLNACAVHLLLIRTYLIVFLKWAVAKARVSICQSGQ